MSLYCRSIVELRENAVLHWPDSILQAAGDKSVLPLLLKTQDAFISLLKVADKDPLSWKKALKLNNALSGPLYLKHLMVLTDLGGEALNKLPPLKKYIPDGVLKFDWDGSFSEYRFKEIQDKCSLANSSLKVDSKKLLSGGELTTKMVDVAMLLMYGSLLVNDSLPLEVKEKCVVGSLIGNDSELERFVKESYIRVSRQVSGATANELGQQVQDYVILKLKKSLPSDWHVTRDKTLPGVAHKTGGDETNFDVIAKSPSGSYFGIEVSFQVTTNSVIERKSREAESLQKSVHKAGHKICYVIDGAGNINIRANAVSNLCNYSDCTVAMSDSEILHLANYMLQTDK
jgi:hypothetical protein